MRFGGVKAKHKCGEKPFIKSCRSSPPLQSRVILICWRSWGNQSQITQLLLPIECGGRAVMGGSVGDLPRRPKRGPPHVQTGRSPDTLFYLSLFHLFAGGLLHPWSVSLCDVSIVRKWLQAQKGACVVCRKRGRKSARKRGGKRKSVCVYMTVMAFYDSLFCAQYVFFFFFFTLHAKLARVPGHHCCECRSILRPRATINTPRQTAGKQGGGMGPLLTPLCPPPSRVQQEETTLFQR